MSEPKQNQKDARQLWDLIYESAGVPCVMQVFATEHVANWHAENLGLSEPRPSITNIYFAAEFITDMRFN